MEARLSEWPTAPHGLRDPTVAPESGPGDAGAAPYISVVVPTRGRPRQLAACLRGLAASPPHERFEVIVVDDGGGTPLDDVIAAFRGSLDLRIVRQRSGGPGAARNAGAALARGELLCFVDDDCVPAPQWLGALAAGFRATPDRLLGGRVVNGLPDNLYASASQQIMSYVYEYYDHRPASRRFFTTNNLAVGAAAFRALGGFDTSIPSRTAEDKEFSDRWWRAGRQLRPVPDAMVYHAHDLTFTGFLRQHHHYGRGIFCFHVTRPRTAGDGLRLEPVSFYLDMVRSPLAGGWSRRALLHAGLILISQFATLSGAVRAALIDVWRLRAARRQLTHR